MPVGIYGLLTQSRCFDDQGEMDENSELIKLLEAREDTVKNGAFQRNV
ncbi:hypothetical protein SAMN05720354_10317 [Nitrosospira sp. Nsp1]|nr:hypothetical protein SAMN05720354_10317 [Nitrosospira sp. Nsp1]